ncbi:oligopeptide transport system permease protein [Microbacteriaceae bacterium SG_E_30_P1]|uniref:Oligopeptide transport system permease protein n=1 Tax=Antiquaquibacter oligotrophicus TaxID=2880260 RepID=A0ABT6KK70_9MICO|nr:ABC transporter permease [Antiquaquibacter oligotrophicus]MDH6180381.1 oligopeptide transport system permease protein [Antiquaquibacter oligotrophicus]UDF13877.1 ABC transporter permease [Antiquaquibacter oligotrophicus]
MTAYILRRLLQAIPVFFGSTLLIYAMVFALPGDPILAMFGDRTPTPEQLAALQERYQLGDNFFVRYFSYLGDLFQGNLGTTFSGQSVNEILLRTFPNTLRLALLAVVIQLLFGVLVGLVSGLRKGSIFDHASLLISLVLISLPVFVLAFVAQFVLGIQLGIFRPTVGPGAPWADLILPAIVLAALNFAYVVRLTRASVIETSQQDFVRMAYGKGLPGRRVIPVHVLRNSLIPVTTNLAADFGILIVGATVTEGIFNVPGVGNELFKAINRHDSPEIVSIVTILVIIYVLVNLLIDLLYGVLDPRIRYVK